MQSTCKILVDHPALSFFYTLFCVDTLNDRWCQRTVFPRLEILHPLYLVTSG